MNIHEEHTLSIKFYLYLIEKVKKDKYPVYARIIYRREKADISMKMIAKVKEWDFENRMFLPTKASNRYKNNKLLSAKDEFLKIFTDLKKKGAFFSVKSIKKEFRGEATSNPSMKFLDYYDSYVDDCKNRPAEYGEGVISHYHKTRRHLYNYMVTKGMLNISLNDLTRNFISDFEQYLLSNKIPGKDHAMCRNTATTYLRKLKAAVNKAVAKDLIERSPFIGYKLPRCKSTNITYLNSEEVEAIINHDMGGNKSLLRVKDLFLFSCYTGLRYSDASTLKTQNIKRDRANVLWLRIRQQKTKDIIEVPMLAPAVELYDKYKSLREETGFVLPQISNQKVNIYLKIIAELTGIQKRLSFHVARHTFATTTTLENGVDLKTVSKLLGHTSIKSTEIYAQVSNKKLIDVIGVLNEKLTF